jgi:1-acyl-sn-glycerol-3-phosphate acyltransferase
VKLAHRIVNAAERALVALLCRVDDAEISKVPPTGPLILVTNHVGFLEVPVLHSSLRPRRVFGLAKAEAWKNPLLGWLFNLWGAIPVRRGETDLGALRKCLEVLEEGAILVIAPEGTRSHHGRLQRGHSGVVTLALRSGAPILPLAFYGGEALGRNVRRFRRTEFHIAVGEPFALDPGDGRLTQEKRRELTDEIMYRLAALLPAEYRGQYALQNADPARTVSSNA